MAQTDTRRWIVECDGEVELHGNRAAAREAARRLNRHPANADIRAFGPYRNVTGRARVIDRQIVNEIGHCEIVSVKRALALREMADA